MEKVKVIIEWASDGTISAMMEKDMFAGMGDTVEAAVADMKEGVALYIKTAKEMGFPYKAYLDGAYEIELEYDAVSALKYAREYIKDTKLAELTGIPAAQLGRYANDKAKPRPAQRRKIVEPGKAMAIIFKRSVRRSDGPNILGVFLYQMSAKQKPALNQMAAARNGTNCPWFGICREPR